jgi:hypothetical protein
LEKKAVDSFADFGPGASGEEDINPMPANASFMCMNGIFM